MMGKWGKGGIFGLQRHREGVISLCAPLSTGRRGKDSTVTNLSGKESQNHHRIIQS